MSSNIKKIAEILYAESMEDPFFSGGKILKLGAYRMMRQILSSLKNIHPAKIDQMFHQCQSPDEIEDIIKRILESKKIEAPSKNRGTKPSCIISSPDW